MIKDQKNSGKELNVLISQPLTDIGRAGNLLWLSFGEQISIIDRKGNERLVRKYALHIQCTWRLIKDKKIILASQDFYFPRTDWKGEEFDWDVPGSNLFDEKREKLKDFFILSNPIITKIFVDSLGDLKVYFTSSIRLDVFADNSNGGEVWRFIQYGLNSKNSEHFVVYALPINHN